MSEFQEMFLIFIIIIVLAIIHRLLASDVRKISDTTFSVMMVLMLGFIIYTGFWRVVILVVAVSTGFILLMLMVDHGISIVESRVNER